jgi:pimeloyl-ACP methyl ester carboxylesterase
MHVRVNGVRLFFDVEGAKLVPDGPVMREKPTLLLLHGGPGLRVAGTPWSPDAPERAMAVIRDFIEHR